MPSLSDSTQTLALEAQWYRPASRMPVSCVGAVQRRGWRSTMVDGAYPTTIFLRSGQAWPSGNNSRSTCPTTNRPRTTCPIFAKSGPGFLPIFYLFPVPPAGLSSFHSFFWVFIISIIDKSRPVGKTHVAHTHDAGLRQIDTELVVNH